VSVARSPWMVEKREPADERLRVANGEPRTIMKSKDCGGTVSTADAVLGSMVRIDRHWLALIAIG
jgi:hypothetical protein